MSSQFYNDLIIINLHNRKKFWTKWNKFGHEVFAYEKIEVDFRLDEPPIVWDPQDAFIENLSTKIYYAVPAFIGGVIVGTILWAFYILLYKTGNCVKNHAFSNNTATDNNATTTNAIEVKEVLI